MYKALVLDAYAVNVLSSATFENEWFVEFDIPAKIQKIKRVEIEGVIYLLSPQAEDSKSMLIVNIGVDGIFEKSGSPKGIFDRLIQITLAHFDRSITIPASWKPYHKDSFLSVYAYPGSTGGGERLYVDCVNDGEERALFAYAVTADTQLFDEVRYNKDVLALAKEHYVDAVCAEKPEQADKPSGSYGVFLTEPISMDFTYGDTLGEWYRNKLTAQQKEFVDKGYLEPVRLRGAAGTGKTLAMVVKLLRDAYRKEDAGESFKFAYLTHSWAVANVVRELLISLDERALWGNWKHVQIKIGSIYDVASELLSFEKKGLKPLSTDGQEGRQLQYELIEGVLKEKLRNPRFNLSLLAKSSDSFREYVKDESRRDNFIYELMNEFACVIDADSIQMGTPEAERYLAARREDWQMHLPEEGDRRVVLDLHETYRIELKEMGVFSIDQVIGDLSKYLGHNEWQFLRDTKGFDAIFVDELHYFTRVERMALHHLFTDSAKSEEGKLPLFMAYDIKQSTNDNFAGMVTAKSASGMLSQTKVGKSSLVELTEVFRYTPEIADFIRDLDGAFPALDLEGEWNDLNLSSDVESGDKPLLITYVDDTSMIDDVFARAQRDSHIKGGRNVVVLCLNEEAFGKYLKAGRLKNKFFPITSREQLPELRQARKKCIFSMPDYVAGMQFEIVYLIHVDKAEEERDGSVGAQRRFVSRVYLGASRAEKKLVLACSDERRGKAPILEGPLKNSSMEMIDQAG